MAHHERYEGLSTARIHDCPVRQHVPTPTPHISVLQREINCLNQENGNRGFLEHMDFDLQNACQSHISYKNLK